MTISLIFRGENCFRFPMNCLFERLVDEVIKTDEKIIVKNELVVRNTRFRVYISE